MLPRCDRRRVRRRAPAPPAGRALRAGGHLALYRTLLPSSGEHAYLAWYEPVVAGLSLVAVVVFGVLLGAAVLGRDGLRRKSCDCSSRRLGTRAGDHPRRPSRPRERRFPGHAGDGRAKHLGRRHLPRPGSTRRRSCSCSRSAPLAALLAVFERSCSSCRARRPPVCRGSRSVWLRLASRPHGRSRAAAQSARRAARAPRASPPRLTSCAHRARSSTDRWRKLAAPACRTTRSPAHIGRFAALAVPGVAQAHHTAVPIVALDYGNRILTARHAARRARLRSRTPAGSSS